MLKHSNPSQFMKRAKTEVIGDIKDLTLVAENFEEEQLADIFTAESLRPLIKSILNSRSYRTMVITEMLANNVYQKLMNELPTNMANEFSSDIAKSWTFSQVLVEYWNKPLSPKQ